MRPNTMRSVMAEGRTALIGWLGMPSTLPAELFSRQGWDAVCIDMQHGLIGYEDAVPMLQAISTADAAPIVRVAGNDAAMIGKALDAGAYGVVCPMINSAAEAAAFLKACHYPPAGMRSAGPLRAGLYGGPDYIAKANETILPIAMIETREALDNLEEILATPGLEAIFVGPSDLSISLGGPPGFDPKTPVVNEAILHIAEACRRHGVIPGIHVGSTAYGVRMVEAGYRFMAYLSDFRMLQGTSSQGLADMRQAISQPVAA